jgi:hypothetical protein
VAPGQPGAALDGLLEAWDWADEGSKNNHKSGKKAQLPNAVNGCTRFLVERPKAGRAFSSAWAGSEGPDECWMVHWLLMETFDSLVGWDRPMG